MYILRILTLLQRNGYQML